ncbi:MAG: cytochrome c3 family protein, partial [Polyangiales bacterium]
MGKGRAALAKILAVLLGSLALLGWLGRHASAVQSSLSGPLALHGARYTGSASCLPCHPGNTASWHRTFHRTMTQRATEDSVLGDFEHGELDYMGVHALMRRDAGGRFVMQWSRRGGLERWSAVVERTVGSRRYQQYLARDGDVYYRLPVAWHVEERRFMHMNGAFLTPDPVPELPGTAIERTDYDRHVTRWNDNCVYCHNVAPSPGLDPESGRFDTRVAELGIACEACHGPASRHIASNRDPLRRFALHLSGHADPTIANPARLAKARSAEVCGHCHGQRIAPDIERVHRDGDRFVPGDDLRAFSRPLGRDTTQNGVHGVFAPRFWSDGTARLTAYEYQGLLQSACTQRGGLTCTDCHAMHGGDPRGQMRPERPGDQICTGCHADLRSDASKQHHSHHGPAGAGARCVECHMPRIVYGLVGAHRSHRIDSPSVPEGADANGRPNACILCHVDRSLGWVANRLRDWSAKARTEPEPALGPAEPEIARL